MDFFYVWTFFDLTSHMPKSTIKICTVFQFKTVYKPHPSRSMPMRRKSGINRIPLKVVKVRFN